MITRTRLLPVVLTTVLTLGTAGVALASTGSHVQDNRATAALNLLEDQGYGIPLGTKDRLGSYAQFQTEGQNFAAYVVRDGVAQRLGIDPESGRITPESARNAPGAKS